MKKYYVAPSMKKKLTLRLDRGILAGSVVEPNTSVETAGQKVEVRDMSAVDFNHAWE